MGIQPLFFEARWYSSFFLGKIRSGGSKYDLLSAANMASQPGFPPGSCFLKQDGLHLFSLGKIRSGGSKYDLLSAANTASQPGFPPALLGSRHERRPIWLHKI